MGIGEKWNFKKLMSGDTLFMRSVFLFAFKNCVGWKNRFTFVVIESTNH